MKLTETNKLEYIIYSLKKAKLILGNDSSKNKTLLKEALENRIEYYKSREKDLEKLSIETLQNYSFQKDLADRYRTLSKLKEIDTIISKYFVKLETHQYAPELNKIYLQRKGKELHVLNVKGCKSTFDVYKYLASNFSSTEISKLHENIKRY